MFGQVAEAVHYLHVEKSIVHRDLKLDNVIFNKETRQICLIDFGFSV